MKKLFLYALLALAVTFVIPAVTDTGEAKAQIVMTLTPAAADDTLTNADTATIYISTAGGTVSTGVADNISRSVQFRFTKLSGTAAGAFTLYGTIDGTNWVSISTDTLTNSTENVKVYSLRNSVGDLQFKQYKGEIRTSGTVTGIPKLYYLRRSN